MSLDFDLMYKNKSVYDLNITHNLGGMAQLAGIYDCLWRPEENGIESAAQMIKPLEDGICFMVRNREECEQLEPSNGWGSYETLFRAACSALRACKEYPETRPEAYR
jgi:hypothetical protein